MTALAYAAGFVDGEGCIGISKNGSVSLTIVNTSLRALQFVRDALGVGKISSRKQRVNKNQFFYRAYGEECIKALHLLTPFLIDKKEQAETLFAFRENCKRIRIPGKWGWFRNPEFDEYRKKMTALKLEESTLEQ